MFKISKKLEDSYYLYFSLEDSNNDFSNLNLKDFIKIKKIFRYKKKQKDYTKLLKYKRLYNVKLKLSNKVFYPQFITEDIIDIVFESLDKKKELRGFEVGSGTGFLSIAIAKNSNFLLDSIDLNKKATKLSKFNSKLNLINKKINFINEDLFKFEFPKNKYDFLISNPPYIDKKDKLVSKWVKKNQPKKAIYSKEKGLIFYHYVIDNIDKIIKKEGFLFFEIGFNQKKDLEKKLLKLKTKVSFSFKKDIEDHWRFLTIKLN